MGARSSTRWRAVPTRNRVENCMTISTKRPRRRAPMPVKALGVWGWNQGTSLLLCWFLNEDAKTGTRRVLRLDFTRDKLPVTQTVRLTSTTPHLGGSRWWFQCPGCGRRVMKLHLPGGVFALPAEFATTSPTNRNRQTGDSRKRSFVS